MHTEVRFLPRRKFLERFISLKDTINYFLVERKSSSAKLFKDLKWLGGVQYLSCVFKKLNKLNFSMQGIGGDIFLNG